MCYHVGGKVKFHVDVCRAYTGTHTELHQMTVKLRKIIRYFMLMLFVYVKQWIFIYN
jgi:hypothetical protein